VAIILGRIGRGDGGPARRGAGAALRRRTSRRGFCPPPGQKVTCNAPPGPPPPRPPLVRVDPQTPHQGPHRECRLPAGMAHVLERSSRAPPAGVWGEAAHRHAREAPPGPIATARTASIPRLHLAALRARPSASPARSRQEPSRGSQGPTGWRHRSTGLCRLLGIPANTTGRECFKDREALLGAVRHPRTKKPFENTLPKSQQTTPFWMLNLAC
jgi:hypothetical protein